MPLTLWNGAEHRDDRAVESDFNATGLCVPGKRQMGIHKRGLAKIELGLARGKRQYDKRQTTKRRDWERQKARLLRAKG